jgi:hypothetical protein
LWQALRERAEQGYSTQDVADMDLSDEVLAILLGIKESDAPYGDED